VAAVRIERSWAGCREHSGQIGASAAPSGQTPLCSKWADRARPRLLCRQGTSTRTRESRNISNGFRGQSRGFEAESRPAATWHALCKQILPRWRFVLLNPRRLRWAAKQVLV
jgi:hypothetical protein